MIAASHPCSIRTAVLLVTLALVPATAQATSGRPNVLLILVDDVGIDQLSVYDDLNGYPAGDPYEYANTPTLDALAADGVRFTQARANPICSPTRAAIQSGRYAFHTGAGAIVRPSDVSPSFVEFSMAPASDEELLPELRALDGYGTGFFGKWHLGLELSDAGTGDMHPLWVGWPHFEGAMHNLNQAPHPGWLETGEHSLPPGYNHWYRVENGQREVETVYATVQQRRDCQEWILENADQPWLAVLSFSACHSPYDYPPDGLHSFPPLWPEGTGVLWDHYRAMVETVDHELGVMFSALGSEMDDTLVIFMADNGSPRPVMDSAREEGQDLGAYDRLVDLNRFKSTVYEMGVRVPLIVSGPMVQGPGRSTDALVDAVDLHATIQQVATGFVAPKARPSSTDAISFYSVLTGDSEAGERTRSLSERYNPNGLPVAEDAVMRSFLVRNGGSTYKLLQQPGQADELYDLAVDPFEANDLGVRHAAYARVANGMHKLLVTP